MTTGTKIRFFNGNDRDGKPTYASDTWKVTRMERVGHVTPAVFECTVVKVREPGMRGRMPTRYFVVVDGTDITTFYIKV